MARHEITLSINIMRDLLWPTVEEIEITEFNPNSLTWLANELIRARHIFRVGTGIRWRN